MPWNFHHQGFPPDLDARIAAASARSEREFNEASRGRSASEARRLLIDVRIEPVLVETAHCYCELARRRLFAVGAARSYIDQHLRALTTRFCPDPHYDSGFSEAFHREAVSRITASSAWAEMLSELQAVAEQIQREIAVESSSSAPGGEAPAAHIETPDNKLLFPNRAIWLQGQLDARKWDVNDLERQKGPSHHSGRKILKSEPVLPVVLERLARVLKVPISDIPDD